MPQHAAPSPRGVHSGSSVPHTAEMLGDTFLASGVVSGAGRTRSSRAALRGNEHPAHIYKGLPMLSLLGSQRFLFIGASWNHLSFKGCGTCLSTDGRVTSLLQAGQGL